MQIFHEVSKTCSKTVTEKYSTSFSLGIKLIHKSIRDDIYAIYGFVRFADEIVDTFHEHNKEKLLQKFSDDTFDAIESGISMNPILHSFQRTVNAYSIEHSLIQSFLESMRMDLEQRTYNIRGLEKYIYGSAEVVGLMCLKIFVNGDTEKFMELKESSQRLGAAFQKVNFLRDIKSDFEERNRIYFPGFAFSSFNAASKKELIGDIENDLKAALEGIVKLPETSRSGVFLAYLYFEGLLTKLRETPAEKIKDSRIRVNNFHKSILLIRALTTRSFRQLYAR